jgi:hypothetical protein
MAPSNAPVKGTWPHIKKIGPKDEDNDKKNCIKGVAVADKKADDKKAVLVERKKNRVGEKETK